jgi:hypothetical protein
LEQWIFWNIGPCAPSLQHSNSIGVKKVLLHAHRDVRSLMKNGRIRDGLTTAFARLQVKAIFVIGAMRAGKYQPIALPVALAGVKFSFHIVQLKTNLHDSRVLNIRKYKALFFIYKIKIQEKALFFTRYIFIW